jgi:hypothetical protein
MRSETNTPPLEDDDEDDKEEEDFVWILLAVLVVSVEVEEAAPLLRPLEHDPDRDFFGAIARWCLRRRQAMNQF